MCQKVKTGSKGDMSVKKFKVNRVSDSSIVVVYNEREYHLNRKEIAMLLHFARLDRVLFEQKTQIVTTGQLDPDCGYTLEEKHLIEWDVVRICWSLTGKGTNIIHNLNVWVHTLEFQRDPCKPLTWENIEKLIDLKLNSLQSNWIEVYDPSYFLRGIKDE